MCYILKIITVMIMTESICWEHGLCCIHHFSLNFVLSRGRGDAYIPALSIADMHMVHPFFPWPSPHQHITIVFKDMAGHKFQRIDSLKKLSVALMGKCQSFLSLYEDNSKAYHTVAPEDNAWNRML